MTWHAVAVRSSKPGTRADQGRQGPRPGPGAGPRTRADHGPLGLNTALDPNPTMVPIKPDRRPNVNSEVPEEVKQTFTSLEEGDPPNHVDVPVDLPGDLPVPAKHEFCFQPEASDKMQGKPPPLDVSLLLGFDPKLEKEFATFRSTRSMSLSKLWYPLVVVTACHMLNTFRVGGLINLVQHTVLYINPIAMTWTARYPIAVENCYV
eukprot:gene19367-26015_t